jgi:hypothetical protein
MEMELDFDLRTGAFNDMKEFLLRSIQSYVMHHNSVKVGITCDPDRRFYEHSNSGKRWKKMVVKYETSSVSYINNMEKALIEHHFDFIENEVNGGGGPNGVCGPYYLYVLLK